MEHRFGGGATGEGHRVTEVSKTVTQQSRPQLEREISAAQRARREPRDRAATVGAAGLATSAAGAGLAGSGKRRIKRVGAAVDRASRDRSEAESRRAGARAEAHEAFTARGAATRELGDVKSRQAALSQWEASGAAMPHTTRIKSGTGRESAYTINKPRGRSHATARNALVNQAHAADEAVRSSTQRERAASQRAERAGREHAQFSRLHERGLELQRKVVPKMKNRIGAGRALMAAGAGATVGALVHTERKRDVGKSLEGASLVEIQKMIGFGDFRGAAGRVRGALSRAGKNPELTSRIKAAKLKRLDATSPLVRPKTPGPVTARLSRAADLRDSLSAPRNTELSRRLAAARQAS